MRDCGWHVKCIIPYQHNAVPKQLRGDYHIQIQSAMHRLVTSLSSAMSMLWSNTAYCVKLSDEDLPRYSNKIESVVSRICPYYHYLAKKVMPQ